MHRELMPQYLGREVFLRQGLEQQVKHQALQELGILKFSNALHLGGHVSTVARPDDTINDVKFILYHVNKFTK